MSKDILPLKDFLLLNNFKFDENNKIILPNGTKHIKLDIGLSFDAPHSQNWIDNDLENNNDIVVFGFEANPEWIRYILSEIKDTNFKDYHTYTTQLKYEYLYKKFFLIPAAIGDVIEPTIMNFYKPELSEGCCSLLEPNSNSIIGSTKEIIQVPVYSLSDFLDLLPFDKIEYIDYIKIDVQGYDINVLKSAKHYLSEKVVYVTAEPETHQYLNSEENSIFNIINYMENIGFTHINHPNTQDPTFINKKFLDKNDIYIWQKY